jgi:hypothetical protein
MSIHPPHEKEQISAITYQLSAAPKIQDDLKSKFGYGENEFFYLDLVENRINNSLLDIAEDLDVKSLYGLTNNAVSILSVGRAFRGYDGEHFPDHHFYELLGKETNDYITEIRRSKGALKGGLARRGRGFWQTHPELLEDICEFRNEGLTWKDTVDEMNERHDKNWTWMQVRSAYYKNKDLPNDEEE